MRVLGSVTLDDNDHLHSITLKSQFPRPEGASDEVLREAASEVATAIGVGALAKLPAQAREWTVHRTRIVLDRDDDCFWFELSLTK